MQVKIVSVYTLISNIMKLQKYYSYTKHIVHPDVVIASTNFLDGLSDADKAIFDQLVDDSTDYEFTAFKKSVQEAKAGSRGNMEQFSFILI